jgi:hypothetical protein
MPNVIMQPTAEGRKPFLLLPRAIHTPGRPALAPPPGRVTKDSSHLHLRQLLRRHNYDVPHLCASLVHGVRSSLPLGCGAGDFGYTGKREEGKDDTVMRMEFRFGKSGCRGEEGHGGV